MDFCKAGRRPVKCFLKKLILKAKRERVSIIADARVDVSSRKISAESFKGFF